MGFQIVNSGSYAIEATAHVREWARRRGIEITERGLLHTVIHTPVDPERFTEEWAEEIAREYRIKVRIVSPWHPNHPHLWEVHLGPTPTRRYEWHELREVM